MAARAVLELLYLNWARENARLLAGTGKEDTIVCSKQLASLIGRFVRRYVEKRTFLNVRLNCKD